MQTGRGAAGEKRALKGGGRRRKRLGGSVGGGGILFILWWNGRSKTDARKGLLCVGWSVWSVRQAACDSAGMTWPRNPYSRISAHRPAHWTILDVRDVGLQALQPLTGLSTRSGSYGLLSRAKSASDQALLFNSPRYSPPKVIKFPRDASLLTATASIVTTFSGLAKGYDIMSCQYVWLQEFPRGLSDI